jgi:hypothetical protein
MLVGELATSIAEGLAKDHLMAERTLPLMDRECLSFLRSVKNHTCFSADVGRATPLIRLIRRLLELSVIYTHHNRKTGGLCVPLDLYWFARQE